MTSRARRSRQARRRRGVYRDCVTTDGSPPLPGRADDLARLEERRARAVAGEAQLLLLAGPAGMGGTTLARRLAATHTAAGGRVGWATGTPWESGEAHAVLGQILGREPAGTDPLTVAGELAEAVGDEPLLWVVDDAEHADPASLQALSTLVRHHRGLPLLVLLVARTTAATPPETAAVLDTVPDQVEPAPLTPAEMQALAADRGVALQLGTAERLARFTGGLPGPLVALLAEQPAAVWLDPDPDLPAPAALAAGVRAELAALDDDARALAEAAAVLGDTATVGEVARLARLEDPLPALDAATRVGLVVTQGLGGTTVLRPRDAMTAAAVRGSLGPQRLAQAHRDAAGLVADPAVRLAHLVAATPLPEEPLAVELEQLADEKAASGEWSVVAQLLIRAAAMTADPVRREQRLSRAVDALVGAGDTRGAAMLVPQLEALRETPMRNAVLGYLALVLGRPAEAETRLSRAWDLVNAEREPATAATICQRWELHSLARCRGRDLTAWADRALALAPEGSAAAVEAAAIRGLGAASVGESRDALAGYLDLAEEVGHTAQSQRVTMARGWVHMVVDEADLARAALASAVPTGFSGGSVRISLWARAWLARVQFDAGEWIDALATARAGLDLARTTGMRLFDPLLSWTIAQTTALRGDRVAAEAVLGEADAGPLDYEIMRVPSCLARAAVAEANADYGAVIRALEPLRQPWAGGSIDEPGFWPWPDVYANALVVEGRYDEADDFLRPHEELARERGHRSACARLGYARGRLLGGTGDLAGARRAFETSLELLADLQRPYDRARVSFAYGQTLRRAGKRAEADLVMQSARDLFAPLGAEAYVERCDHELRAGGVHAARGSRDDLGLTPQEELVSRLVAQGMTNREVAAELYLSVKTVQYHLTRVYAKLGIRSRAELAALRRTS